MAKARQVSLWLLGLFPRQPRKSPGHGFCAGMYQLGVDGSAQPLPIFKSGAEVGGCSHGFSKAHVSIGRLTSRLPDIHLQIEEDLANCFLRLSCIPLLVGVSL